MPRRSSRSGADSRSGKSEDGGRRLWRSRSRTRSRSRGRNPFASESSHEGNISTGYASSGGVIGDSADYAYVTSPPKAKSGLTGNISSLFRTVKRGISGGERRSSKSEIIHDPYQYSQQQGQAYGSSLGAVTSPENAVFTRNDVGAASVNQSHTQFLGSAASTQQNQRNNTRTDNDFPINQNFSGSRSLGSRTGSRLFYSNADDDSNSENSFDEKSRAQNTSAQSSGTGTNTTFTDGTRSESEVQTTTILRYRGFSTSIKSLFLDEALVCASMGCFGLILSNRTEYLLQLRNERRGVKWGRTDRRGTLPSKILAYALLLTLILIGVTFVIGGFGSDSNNTNPFSFNSGRNKGGSSSSSYNDDAVNQNQYNNMNDDGGNDDAQYNADDYNHNGDDDNGGANDDANNNENEDADDDANDDANDNANDNANDDANVANDDAQQNYYDYNYGEGNNNKYYNNNGGRHLDRLNNNKMHQKHCVNGIFKIRDMKEGLWEPTIDFLSDEWYRPYQERNLQNYANVNDDYSSASASSGRDIASQLRISLVFAFLFVLGILGRRRRMRTRYYLVRARAQEDHLFYASSGSTIKRVGFQDSREDQYEGACSHTLFGCYPKDPAREGDEVEDEVQVNDDGVIQRKKKPYHEDCVSRGFNCLLGFCCGFVCRCWFQCLSICALAQEAREMRLLVPTRYQRVDYITHQPFHEYQKEVNDLRRGWMGRTRKKSGIMPHLKALSRLSRYILFLSISLTSIIGATLYFNPKASFSWPDVIILSATFLQSFLVLWIVHWIFHKSDLSLDAVIKFFSAGFVIAVPSAFFFEGVLVNVTLISAVLGYSLGQLVGGDIFVEWIAQHYRLLWILVEIGNAYIVATVTEELCKYYTFRCVEHPDLIFLTGLVSTTQDERALEGGVVKYPFSSHQVQRTNARNPYDDDASVYSKSSHRSRASGKNANLEPEEDQFEEDDNDVRTYQQKAAAVTTAMISVAVGLACAENFLYVFLLGGTGGGAESDDGYLQEWIVLFFRSIFPVHALAAAMQSVNMIRKFVETDTINGHRIGVGRIIMPAVIMHGTFDAILLGINVYIETSWDKYLEANAGNVNDDDPTPYNSFLVNLVAWISISFVMLAGFIWYYRENRKQRLRLIEMEEHERAMGSPGYVNPRVPPVTDVELV
mmetsp:Transcript_5258/g.12535  ORF Transcript_5258/g.12535 Transcript_5258/m.12535 type:complete len:1161 (-) Transcript_5258:138-3620(-)